jgi:predicted DsbA family dithiol-disulfide isomerase
MPGLKIDHYSDVLCVWAYISQIRVREACDKFCDDIAFSYHYLSVFADVNTKMATQWAPKGGLAGYADHVHQIAARFQHVRLHE